MGAVVEIPLETFILFCMLAMFILGFWIGYETHKILVVLKKKKDVEAER